MIMLTMLVSRYWSDLRVLNSSSTSTQTDPKVIKDHTAMSTYSVPNKLDRQCPAKEPDLYFNYTKNMVIEIP